DVPPGSTFYLFVERVASIGIINGYPCGGPGEPCEPDNLPYFRPGANATRGQIAKIVSDAAGFSDVPPTQIFEDVNATHTFYLWVQRLASRSIISGYPCGSPGEPCITPGNRPYFRTASTTTRGQTAKITSSAFFPGCITQHR
ncbi:MAG: S-layer homology domain-containing protein, partial [Chloroflexia bacterium]